MREIKVRIETPLGYAPVLILRPRGHCGTALVYHGLGAGKEVQHKEMVWLAEAGFTAVCVDAPHHGERADGYLEMLTSAETANQHFLVMKLVSEAIQEIPAVVEYCVQQFPGNVCIVGISLGGFIAYGAPVVEPRIKASVPILGSPDWNPKVGHATAELQALMEHAPARFPEKFPPCAVFAANARRDIYVPPRASREFIQTLQNEYQACPERLQYLEYPDSEHMMREEDWNDLWQRVLFWFYRFLV